MKRKNAFFKNIGRKDSIVSFRCYFIFVFQSKKIIRIERKISSLSIRRSDRNFSDWLCERSESSRCWHLGHSLSLQIRVNRLISSILSFRIEIHWNETVYLVFDVNPVVFRRNSYKQRVLRLRLQHFTMMREIEDSIVKLSVASWKQWKVWINIEFSLSVLETVTWLKTICCLVRAKKIFVDQDES